MLLSTVTGHRTRVTGTPDGSDAAPDVVVETGTGSCPASVVLGAPTSSTTLRGAGVMPSTDLCPAGQAVIGYMGATSGRFVQTLQTQCGQLSIVATGPTCRVSVSPGAMMPVRGAQAPSAPWMLTCPTDQVVVVANGHFGGRIDELGVECAPLDLTWNGSSYALTIGAPTAVTPQGGPGGNPFRDPCPTGQIANGNVTSYSGWIDAFQLLCSTPAFSP